MPDRTGLLLKDVSVTYGDVVAVAPTDWAVASGEVVALLGPSGCGKSSLLRAVAGLEPLSGGVVTWNGIDLAELAVHRRGIGLMFQHHALFPHRNVADNVGFGLKMQGLTGAEIARRTEELLAMVGLPDMGSRTIGTLSGGQAQRVALARALAPEPGLLLLDEPLGSLDRALRDHLVTEIRAIVTRLGITTIHVTHDHDEAVSIADRLVFMDAGHIVGSGAVDDVLTSPKTVATATALGIDTVLACTVGDDGRAVTPFGPVPVSSHGDAVVFVLLRPQAVSLVTRPAPISPAQTADGVVVATRYRGNAWLVTCRLGTGQEVVAEHSHRLAEGTSVTLTANLQLAEQLRP